MPPPPAVPLAPGCVGAPSVAPWPSLVESGRGEWAWAHNAIHLGFFDTRSSARLNEYEAVLKLATHVEGSHVPIVPHAILFYDPGPLLPDGFVLHNLQHFRHGTAVSDGGNRSTLAQCLYSNLMRLCHGPGREYVWKPLLHLMLPPSIDRILLLDTDTVVLKPLSQLWRAFHEFGPSTVLGLSHEQSNLYEMDSGWKESGKNGGVQLLNLRRMRTSHEYNLALDYFGRGEFPKRIGYLGDQTLYTHMAGKWPTLFHQLGCEWNRQISPHFGFANVTVHQCPRPCAILHANDNRLKCVAAAMQKHLASCKLWHGFIDDLQHNVARPADAPIPPNCPNHRLNDQNLFHGQDRRSFPISMRTYFWDCCLT